MVNKCKQLNKEEYQIGTSGCVEVGCCKKIDWQQRTGRGQYVVL